jgi:ABC-type antimicrobial peptide transport system permease subunit
MIRVLRRLLLVTLSVWVAALLAYSLHWFDPATNQQLGVGLARVNGWAIDRLSWAVGVAGWGCPALADRAGVLVRLPC